MAHQNPTIMLTVLERSRSTAHSVRTYLLAIRQQPVQGRMCGFGSKDRRPLDPVPIVQLRVEGPYGRDEA